MVKHSLEDQGRQTPRTLRKRRLARQMHTEEAKATEELEMTTKALKGSKRQLETAHSTCLQVAADHEATVAARKRNWMRWPRQIRS